MIQLDVLTAEEQEKCRKITETDKTIRESLAFPVLFFVPSLSLIGLHLQHSIGYLAYGCLRLLLPGLLGPAIRLEVSQALIYTCIKTLQKRVSNKDHPIQRESPQVKWRQLDPCEWALQSPR